VDSIHHLSAITQQRVTLLSLQYVMLWQIPEHHCTDTSKNGHFLTFLGKSLACGEKSLLDIMLASAFAKSAKDKLT